MSPEVRTVEDLLAKHPLFADLATEHVAAIAGCGENLRFAAGDYVFREGEPADRFYVIRHGKVALEVYLPERGAVSFQTLAAGDVLGWSWLFPPFRWHFDARAVERARVTALDGRCLREKCDADPALGYQVVQRFARIAVERLQAARLQLLDMYGRRSPP